MRKKSSTTTHVLVTN